MPLYSGNKKYGIVKVVSSARLEELKIIENNVYTPSAGIDGFGKVTSNVPNRTRYYSSPYVVDKKFVRPIEWDNIESIEIADNEQVCYLLYDNTKPLSFMSIKTTLSGSGNVLYEFGRVSNGLFTKIDEVTKTSGSAMQKMLSDDYPNQDYIVVKITCTTAGRNITAIANGGNYTYNKMSMSPTYQNLIMRYASLPYATNFMIGTTYMLVSDYIKNATNFTSLSSYMNDYNLVRLKFENCSTAKVTSFSNFLNNCYNMVEFDFDIANLITNKAINLSSMFANCYNLYGVIDTTKWDMTNVTNATAIFANCYNITQILGLEDWDFSKVTNISTILSGCNSLWQNKERKLDVRKWNIGTNIASTVQLDMGSVFATLYKIEKIDLSTWNLDNIKGFKAIFNACENLKEIKLPNTIGANGYITDINTCYQNCCALRKIELDKFTNLTNLSSMNNLMSNCYSVTEVTSPTTTPLGSTANTMFSQAFGMLFNLETLDLGWIDLSKYTYSNVYNDMFKNCINLVNLTPPRNIKDNFKVNECFNLSRESLLAIIDNLQTVSGKTLTLGVVNRAKLTADELAIATGKGWTIA